MNKKVIYALTAIALQSVVLQSARADFDGKYYSTVKITSNIVASPCTVDSESVNASITMPTMTAAAFLAGYKADYSTPLQIKLTNCPETTTRVIATITGTPSTLDGTLFKNTSAHAGDTANIGVDLEKVTAMQGGVVTSMIQLKNGSVISNIGVNNGEAGFSLLARMANPDGNTEVGAGMVSSAVSINFAYK